ncbi:unknown [Macaca mulatta rhadinovirus 17577]|uniref:ORF69 n=2 Tax=Macacine gammaherpesvirus 5 TaxID=154334 RepID=Q77NH7_9GAMA|nr:hypothetical protein MmrVgp80 [Macacine gammaherpesvirus 5]AAD21403.1 unknown [Macaca mulatta rhadinovirus 17577]AAF60056.1 ORF69 [Rhesus monkey rhadinovirus H26-95]WUF06369.1 hypothetical protein [synthetic construct]WVG99678.1 unknown [Macaca mulatta rhadinovirus]QFN51654.1 ORF 69 [Macacine gammaherpesvirus 5]
MPKQPRSRLASRAPYAPSVRRPDGPQSTRPASRHGSCKSEIMQWKKLVSDTQFFSALTRRHELGVDFLREMGTPICTSKSVMLPLNLKTIAPGRCVSLSSFGHSSNMGFNCSSCTPTDRSAVSLDANALGEDSARKNSELCSVALTFYHHAEKVVQHKGFYLSLLSHSMEVVRKSFTQPGLLYAHLVLKTFGHDPLPIFTVDADERLALWAVFHTRDLHLGETSLRLIMDNLPNYDITVDCIKQTYIMKFTPSRPDNATVTVPVNSICEAVATLDCTDEFREEIQRGTAIINSQGLL